MKYVLFYESAEGVAEKAPVQAPAHGEYWRSFRQQRGEPLLIGPFGDPQSQGAMGIFSTREGAEEFAAKDPFVVNGVVRSWEVWEWDESVDPSE